jgi:DNA repair ATPase RecN
LTSKLHSDVDKVVNLERQLQNEARLLDEQSKQCVTLIKQWMDMSNKLNNSLKELGMITHYCTVIEGDIREVAETLRLSK